MTPTIVVHDPDGINPYGREVAIGLHRCGLDVRITTAADAEWVPSKLADGARRLPTQRTRGSKARQAGRLIAGTGRTIRFGMRGNSIVIVAWTRSALEDLLLGVLARARRNVILINHNPIPRPHIGRIRRGSGWVLRRLVPMMVVHSAALESLVETPLAAKVEIVPIPSYRGWVEHSRCAHSIAAPRPRPKVGLLFFGNLRPDKGVAELPKIFSYMGESERERISITVCGWGSLPTGFSDELIDLGIQLHDRTSSTFVPDADLWIELINSDLVVAPYVAATQSASISLALTAGAQVLAYDSGAIADLLSTDGLVPRCDAEEFGRRIGEFIATGRAGGPRQDPAAWESSWAKAWVRVINQLESRA